MAQAICSYCADEYDDEDGDVCECGAEICSPDCMDNHLGRECDKYDEEKCSCHRMAEISAQEWYNREPCGSYCTTRKGARVE